MRSLEEFELAATGLAHHPQDHGWRNLYRLFEHGLDRSAPNLSTMLRELRQDRPTLSPTHLLTVLGIALKHTASANFHAIASDGPMDARLDVLDRLLEQYHDRISDIVRTRQNSFTSARRFLLPQVLLSAYFATAEPREVRFADLGTGLGVLPRQLNSAQQFDSFSPDLAWPDGIPAFREIPLVSRHGIDRGPMPDLEWVTSCYGSSSYYSDLHDELIWTAESTSRNAIHVNYQAIDLLDTEAISEFIHSFQINAVNLSYVLYEFDQKIRSKILKGILDELHPPGIAIVSEPHKELHGQGTVVEFYEHRAGNPMTLCYVSDGHYKGHVLPLDDYDSFVRDHPIEYSSESVSDSVHEVRQDHR